MSRKTKIKISKMKSLTSKMKASLELIPYKFKCLAKGMKEV